MQSWINPFLFAMTHCPVEPIRSHANALAMKILVPYLSMQVAILVVTTFVRVVVMANVCIIL